MVPLIYFGSKFLCIRWCHVTRRISSGRIRSQGLRNPDTCKCHNRHPGYILRSRSSRFIRQLKLTTDHQVHSIKSWGDHQCEVNSSALLCCELDWTGCCRMLWMYPYAGYVHSSNHLLHFHMQSWRKFVRLRPCDLLTSSEETHSGSA